MPKFEYRFVLQKDARTKDKQQATSSDTTETETTSTSTSHDPKVRTCLMRYLQPVSDIVLKFVAKFEYHFVLQKDAQTKQATKRTAKSTTSDTTTSTSTSSSDVPKVRTCVMRNLQNLSDIVNFSDILGDI